jgi:hypothetical protein
MTTKGKSEQPKAKTYEVQHKGKKVKVTVPESEEVAFDEAIKNNLSPSAVAAIAAHLRAASTKDAKVNAEIRAFTELLINLLGTDKYNRLCEEVGL